MLWTSYPTQPFFPKIHSSMQLHPLNHVHRSMHIFGGAFWKIQVCVATYVHTVSSCTFTLYSASIHSVNILHVKFCSPFLFALLQTNKRSANWNASSSTRLTMWLSGWKQVFCVLNSSVIPSDAVFAVVVMYALILPIASRFVLWSHSNRLLGLQLQLRIFQPHC